MKSVKLYEQFVNERRLNKRDLKEVAGDYGYDAYLEDDHIAVYGENPWDDDKEYTFTWDGENAYCETDFSDSTYNEPVTSAAEFSMAIDDTDNWE
jgi:hypothetical protein